MNLEDRDIEDIDMTEEYDMMPLEPMMYGYGQMNMMPNMGINQSLGMNPNMGMNSNMGMPMGYMQDMNPNMGMYPCMGMNQFNEGALMNTPNPVGMMYGDSPINDYSDEDEGLRQLGMYDDKDSFKGQYNNPHKYSPKHNDVDYIVRRIERYNPAIFRILTRCGIPYAEAKTIVRRIVRMTLMYSEG